MSVKLLKWPSHDSDSMFQVFWDSWPEQYRIARGAARREWDRLRPTRQQAEEWTLAVIAQRESKKWRDGFVPSPKNWLRDERWADPVEKVPEPAGYWLCPHQPRCHAQPWCVQFRDAADARKREKGDA